MAEIQTKLSTNANVAEEVRQILKLVGGDFLKAYEMLERQMATLALRTQVMLSLSGIVVTVTGFSGRAIAETSDLARLCISSGILIVLSAAVVAVVGVLHLRWLSQQITDDEIATLHALIERRDRKSGFLSASMVLFAVGFSLYCVAIAQLLIAAKVQP